MLRARYRCSWHIRQCLNTETMATIMRTTLSECSPPLKLIIQFIFVLSNSQHDAADWRGDLMFGAS